MNKERRAAIAAIIKDAEALKEKLSEIVSEAERLKEAAEGVRDEEQDYFDNMPPSFQDGEKGQAAEEKVSALDDAINEIDSLIDSLGDDGPVDSFISGLETAAE